MRLLWRKLRWSLVHRGLLGTLKAVPAALNRGAAGDKPHPFDQRYGTDTSGVIGGALLATGHPHDIYITAYAGIPPSRFESLLERWRSTLGAARIEDYTFIDLGCGKGRAVLLASRLPFREVVGIEINPQLAETAQRNVERWKSLGEARSSVRIVVGDATEPTLPGGPSLLFLYNAFAESLVHRLARNIGRSHSGPVDLIYQNANSTEAFTAQLGFREVWLGNVTLSTEDVTAEDVASPEDLTALFRCD